ncbi:MAG: 50S ribosomal protein L24 [Oscillospiraceae bacterium]|nr:50S ribosomal protein L24 [Oscillospiraceae bacterium]MDD4367772.1 50S ribosomal protein L24 [Oscillospiraceae bacterium]
MAKVHIKVGDTVYIRTGKDRAKTGEVTKVLTSTGRVIVKGVNIVKKHQKPNNQNQAGGIIEKEASIAAANCMLVCSSCKKPVKIGYKFNDAGNKVRICKACGAEIETVSHAAKA